jgi:LmbE family N-acetylglucosaminyl deacetylase
VINSSVGDVCLDSRNELISRIRDDLVLANPVDIPTVVVIAHPDDEVLAMGGRLGKFTRLTLLQLTDGAPRDAHDAIQLGFPGCDEYLAEREREARRALSALGLHCRRICLNTPDQDSIFWLRQLASEVQYELRAAGLVFTHPYEAGHPDHDTAALIVQSACARIAASGRTAPARIEFSSYHNRDGQLVTGRFWPDLSCPETMVTLDDDAHTRKCRALAQYRTQAHVISTFCTRIESYRAAPLYDFSRAAPPGIAQYDLFGWSMTAARWRETAASLLHLLGEPAA